MVQRCCASAQRCCASCVYVCHRGATLLRVVCARVPLGRNTVARRVARVPPGRNTVARHVCTCATGAQHCCASCVHVCHWGATLLRVTCARVPRGRNAVARHVCTCATGAQHCCACCVHVCIKAQRCDTGMARCDAVYVAPGPVDSPSAATRTFAIRRVSPAAPPDEITRQECAHRLRARDVQDPLYAVAAGVLGVHRGSGRNG
jgi:hypothetical protein